jgi:3-deoxy-manno-octulosonate cytidylyltransferase (CMP-KDO synthetase)
MLHPLLIIPARLAAVRLPRKPLADINGEPMIAHVWRRAVAADIGTVVVATDSTEIVDIIHARGGRAVLTSPDHPSGSDRVFEAANVFDPDQKHDILLNIQGDLPNIDPKTLQATLKPLQHSEALMSTPAAVITHEAEHTDPNVVKIVATPISDTHLRALYFSRATVPYGEGVRYHHIGVYAWRRAALARFVTLPPSPLEIRERLEQLRALEDGMRIDVAVVEGTPISVDTQADLERARVILA